MKDLEIETPRLKNELLTGILIGTAIAVTVIVGIIGILHLVDAGIID